MAVHLPGRAPVPLGSNDINFAPGFLAIDDDASCTGSSAAPTAPAGKVCIYPSTSANTDRYFGQETTPTAFRDRAFEVWFSINTPTSGADAYLNVTWAYTAP